MKENIEKLLVVVLLFIFGCVFIAKGIVTLSAKNDTVTLKQLYDDDSKGDYVEGDVSICLGKCYRITHKVNFIPTGKEYYYVIYNDTLTKYMVVRAGKDWSDNFEPDGINWSGVHIKGAVYGFDALDYNVRNYIAEDEQRLKDIGDGAEAANCYIDLLSDRYAILSIICGIIFWICSLLEVIYIKVVKKETDEGKLWIIIPMGVMSLIGICLFIHVFAMTF